MKVSPVTSFLLKALGFFLAWYVVYEIWILPDGRLDARISVNIATTAAGLLEAMGYDVYSFGRIVGIYGDSGVEVTDRCNGIAILGLYLAFILAYPGRWDQRAAFSVLGLAIIYLTNLFRIALLTVLKVEWPEGFSFVHDFATTGIFYLVVFVMWIFWVKANEEPINKAL